MQESLYPSVYTNQYKFGFSEAGNFCYYDYSHDHVLNNQVSGNEVQDRHLENPSTIAESESVAADMHQQENLGANSMECEFCFLGYFLLMSF